MTTILDRLAYGAAQGARVSWYVGQKLLAARLADPAPPAGTAGSGEPAPSSAGPMPDVRRILRDLGALLARDLRNVEAGYYALPVDLIDNPVAALRRSRRFFADLPHVTERRRAARNSEVFDPARRSRYPRYYLQNFHYQTDGWLSHDSAALYDHQVEVLFSGGADAMRRQGLVPLYGEVLRRGGVSGMKLIDVACGTGRFLREVKNNYPRLDVTALDLSPYYLDAARRNLADWSRTGFVEAAAESMPLPDGAYDVVSCIYLFHELPRKQRRLVAREIARILKPGGLLILIDSLQRGDEPDYDGLLDYFPHSFHEPYFADYVREDLAALFGETGLAAEESTLAYFSKVATFRKAGAATS